MKTLEIEPLTPEIFASFGDLIEAIGTPDKLINQGRCGRFHDLAKMDFSDGRAGISIFKSELCTFPYEVTYLERHPDGSQAFAPMSDDGFLIVVAEDVDGKPSTPRAFITAPGQVINFHKNTWHGTLAPLSGNGLFAVIDRIGEGANLEEHWFKTPYTINED